MSNVPSIRGGTRGEGEAGEIPWNFNLWNFINKLDENSGDFKTKFHEKIALQICKGTHKSLVLLGKLDGLFFQITDMQNGGKDSISGNSSRWHGIDCFAQWKFLTTRMGLKSSFQKKSCAQWILGCFEQKKTIPGTVAHCWQEAPGKKIGGPKKLGAPGGGGLLGPKPVSHTERKKPTNRPPLRQLHARAWPSDGQKKRIHGNFLKKNSKRPNPRPLFGGRIYIISQIHFKHLRHHTSQKFWHGLKISPQTHTQKQVVQWLWRQDGQHTIWKIGKKSRAHIWITPTKKQNPWEDVVAIRVVARRLTNKGRYTLKPHREKGKSRETARCLARKLKGGKMISVMMLLLITTQTERM